MTMDKALCAICAWRGDCNKKFMHGDGIHCPDYTRNFSIRARAEEKGPVEPTVRDTPGMSKTDLFKL